MALPFDPDPVFVRGREHQGLVIMAIRRRKIVHQARQVAKHLKRLKLSPLRDGAPFSRIDGPVRPQDGNTFFQMRGRLAQRIA